MAIPATLPPADASASAQPSAGTPAEASALGGVKRDGVAARLGPTGVGPPRSETGSAPLATVAGAADPAPLTASPAGPALTETPAATAMTGASPPQSTLAAVQQEQAAVPLPVRIEAAAAPPQGAAAAASPDTSAAAPAQQVSAALVSLAGTPGGGQRMTLRLEPAELGQVQIRIDRPTDAPAQVDISVQRPETLTSRNCSARWTRRVFPPTAAA